MPGGSKSGVFTFDSFKLDGDKLMLYRDGVEVSIPPKVAKTLAVLVESAGSIISKDELIERVWDDSIVEESNLTQYLYLLRKVLGNMPDGRPYIETLRRRGYRFNADVEEIVSDSPAAARPAAQHAHVDSISHVGDIEREGNVLRVVNWQSPDTDGNEPSPAAVANDRVDDPVIPAAGPVRRALLPRLAIAAVILVLGVAVTTFFWLRSMPAAINAESQKEISVVRLTDGFFPHGATISPDGNVFAYHETDGDVTRMFVQQAGQLSRIEILSSSSQSYVSKTFSRDSRSIFFVALDKKTQIASVYKIAAMGGTATKILDDIHGGLSLSPNGAEMVFCRRNRDTGDTSLVIAASDGRTERVVLQRSNPDVLQPSPSWSPDGKLIAYSDREAHGGTAATLRVHLLDIATGKSSQLSEENWDGIFRLIWAADGRGIFSVATREGESYSTRRDQIYFTSYPEGLSRRLTNDGNRHEPDSLGVTNTGDVLAVSSNRSSQVWVMNANGDANTAVQLTRGSADGRAGIGILPDGRFAYLTRKADEIPIMLADADGSGSKAIASGFPYLEELRADPKGRYFVFSTVKDGKNRIFRIDIDGSNLKQLTPADGSIDSSFSPDGKHLVFDGASEGNDMRTYSVMRVDVEGGEITTLAKGCFLPTYSPDGSMISCVSSLTHEIVLISASDGSEIERFPMPAGATWNFGIGWTSDGSGLVYIHNDKRTSNLWILPRDRTAARALTNFTSGVIHRYVFSPDRSRIYIARGYPAQDAFLIKNFR